MVYFKLESVEGYIYVGCLLFHRRITSHFFPLSPSRYRPGGKGKTGR